MRWGIATARRAWLTAADVANTRSWDEFAALRKRARARQPRAVADDADDGAGEPDRPEHDEHGRARVVERAVGEDGVADAEHDDQAGEEAVHDPPRVGRERQPAAQRAERDDDDERDRGHERHPRARRPVGRQREERVVGLEHEQRADVRRARGRA